MPAFSSAQRLTLSSSRQLGFAIHGDPAGIPVFYMHGLYGSRLEALLATEAAEKIGVQLIAADRPGIGESTPEPGRSLKSWAENINELANHLGHEKFYILGVSGGGPYSLSCAFHLSERVLGVALCGGLGPLNNKQFNQQLPAKYKFAIWAGDHCPPALKLFNLPLYYGARLSPGLLLKILGNKLSACDKNLLAEESIKRIFFASLTEAAKQGPLYGAQELTIFGSDWNFPLSTISTRIDIWHGDHDKVVPVAMAHHLEDSLQQSSLHILPGEGHFSLPILHSEKIFHSLLRHHLNPPD